MIMQSYDFYALVPESTAATCSLEEMISGATCLAVLSLIRRKLGKNAYAMTINSAAEFRRQKDG